MAERDRIRVGGRNLRFTHPDKVLYPATGTTKQDVLEYVLRASDPLMAHMMGRPVTRKRWPEGVGTEGAPGEVFFQKGLERGAPAWIPTIEQQHSTGKKQYPVVSEPAVLAWMVQLGALELHVPQWRVVDGERWNPDRLVLDLDPGEGADLDDCARVALWVRELLVDIGLDPVPLTSGSKGIHLYARLDGTVTSEQASEVAHQLARSLEQLHPDLVVSDMKKSLRTGKVLIDWSQNSASKTTVAPYSLRGRMRPTVAAPRTWEEVEAGGLRQLEMGEVLERLERDGDLIAALDPPPDRLAKYRGLRRADRTPEPVPGPGPVPLGEGNSWVVHEHHARRLHYDLRLEQDGVLVSWAVPKGLPGAADGNRLAVQTEDHPLEYGAFEGTIPKGEYGAGRIAIWDAGEVELEKFRDDEVIGTLRGSPDGGLGGEPYRFALIRTDADARQWLLHRMKEQDPVRDARKKGYAPPVARGAAGQRSAAAGHAAGSRADAEPKTRLRPMLATAGDASDIDDEREWSFELKWDGWRAIVQLSGDEVRLLSRNGKEYTQAFPELVAALPAAIDAEEAVLDGEIVVLRRSGAGAGTASFAALQDRGGLDGLAAAKAAERSPATLLLFDALEVEGRRLVDLRLDERQQQLAAIVQQGARVRLSTPLQGELADVLEATAERGLEGVMAKRLDGRYRSGARSTDWLKLKHTLAREVVVVGWLEGKGALAGTIGSLVLALPREGGRMRYAGRVGTGFTDAERDRLRDALRPRETAPALDDLPADVARGAHWVRATVAEVEHTEQTASGALRHPVWRGLRPDKALGDLHAE